MTIAENSIRVKRRVVKEGTREVIISFDGVDFTPDAAVEVLTGARVIGGLSGAARGRFVLSKEFQVEFCGFGRHYRMKRSLTDIEDIAELAEAIAGRIGTVSAWVEEMESGVESADVPVMVHLNFNHPAFAQAANAVAKKGEKK